MMEKYFIVTEKSKLNKEYWDYKNNIKEVNEAFKEFADNQDIESSKYATRGEYLYIIPTEKDLERFEKQFCKERENGIRQFKKNSKIGRGWIKTLKNKELKVKGKPFIPLYFNCYANTTWTRLFHIGENVYCSYRAEIGKIDCPDWMIEIKASEFHKIIEENSAN